MVRVTALAGILATLLSALGCIIVPIPRSTEAEGARCLVQTNFIRVGETRRHEVLLRLGEPEELSGLPYDSDCYLCDVQRVDVHWAVVIPAGRSGAGVGGVVRSASRDYLFIQYGADGIVKDFILHHQSFPVDGAGRASPEAPQQLAKDWEAGRLEAKPEPSSGRGKR